MTVRRLIFWCMAALFALASVLWTLVIPAHPENLFDVIPPSIRWASYHRHLSQRWEKILAIPVVQDGIRLGGTDPDVVAGWARDPQARYWLRHLASRDVVVAYVPHMGYQGKPAWVASAWVGGFSQRIRWMLMVQPPSGLQRMKYGPGHMIWTFPLDPRKPVEYLSFSLLEGMIVGAISQDPMAVTTMVDLADRRRPGSGRVPYESGFAAIQSQKGLSDVGWFFPGFTPEGRWRPPVVAQCTELSTNRCVVKLILPPGCTGKPGDPAVALDVMERFLGSTPALLGMAPWSLWRSGLDTMELSTDLKTRLDYVTGNSVSSTNDVPVIVGMLKSPYNARIKGPLKEWASFVPGLKTPVMFVAVATPAGAGVAEGRVLTTLDALNASDGWGLIPHEYNVGTHRLVSIEGTRPNVYGHFELDEQVAFLPLDQWMVWCSNAGTLRRLIEEADRRGVPQNTMKATPLAHSVSLQGRGPINATIDVGETLPVLRQTLGTISLVMMMQNTPAAAQTRRDLGTLTRWTALLKGMDTIDIRTVNDGATNSASPEVLVVVTLNGKK